jgi:hypothetical protein
MKIINYLFPSKAEKLKRIEAKMKRQLWMDCYIAELKEGRENDQCEITAYEAVEAFDNTFNKVNINLN